MVLGTDVNTVAFGGSRGYTPRCLKVKAGATVTIQASPRHPLEFVATSLVKATDPVAPSQVPVTRVFTEPGVFGFFCSVHGDASGAGMAGVIVVEPAHAPSALTNESLSPGENR
jgi:plastocyanin